MNASAWNMLDLNLDLSIPPIFWLNPKPYTLGVRIAGAQDLQSPARVVGVR